MRVCNVIFSCLLFVVVVCFVVVFLLKFNGFVSFGVCFICFLALPLFVLFVSGCLILHDRCFTCLCVLSFFSWIACLCFCGCLFFVVSYVVVLFGLLLLSLLCFASEVFHCFGGLWGVMFCCWCFVFVC